MDEDEKISMMLSMGFSDMNEIKRALRNHNSNIFVKNSFYQLQD